MITTSTLPLSTLVAPVAVKPIEPTHLKLEPKVEAQAADSTTKPVSTFGKELDVAVQELSAQLGQRTKSQLEVKYDKGAGRQVIKVVDPKSGAVILQVPAEEALAMSRKLKQAERDGSSRGSLIDQEA